MSSKPPLIITLPQATKGNLKIYIGRAITAVFLSPRGEDAVNSPRGYPPA